jgi:hypothetical protein
MHNFAMISPQVTKGRLAARLCRFVRVLVQTAVRGAAKATKGCLQIFSGSFSCVTLTES